MDVISQLCPYFQFFLRTNVAVPPPLRTTRKSWPPLFPLPLPLVSSLGYDVGHSPRRRKVRLSGNPSSRFFPSSFLTLRSRYPPHPANPLGRAAPLPTCSPLDPSCPCVEKVSVSYRREIFPASSLPGPYISPRRQRSTTCFPLRPWLFPQIVEKAPPFP